MKEKFKLLERGLLFYPVKDKGKKFKVGDTWTINLKKEDFEKFAKGDWSDTFPFKTTKNTIRFDKFKLYGLMYYFEEVLWKKILEVIPEEELKKADWIHPTLGSFMNFKGETEITVHVDLLKKIRW